MVDSSSKSKQHGAHRIIDPYWQKKERRTVLFSFFLECAYISQQEKGIPRSQKKRKNKYVLLFRRLFATQLPQLLPPPSLHHLPSPSLTSCRKPPSTAIISWIRELSLSFFSFPLSNRSVSRLVAGI